MTSHDVVDVVRRAYGERSIGHLGTLDPFATGLLVLLLGRSTRLATFIENEPKKYKATIQFGAETDTDDCTGRVIRHAPVPSIKHVRAALPSLTGDIDQVPPAYSAKKVDGVRAYDMARDGIAVALAPSRVHVETWRIRDIRERDGDLSIDVTITCGSGTYIRALARDLGRLTDSAAHLTSLRRVRSGPFSVRDAVTLDDIRSDDRPGIRPLRVVVGNPATSA